MIVVSGLLRRLCLLAMTAMVFSCAPQEQSHIANASGTPKLETNLFLTADMAMLPYRAWLPKGKPKAVIVALHGFNDYSNAFATVGPYFAKRRIAFYAYDQRGFGQAPQTGIWGNEHNLAGDLVQFMRLVSSKHPRAPLYILGESMGGAVAMVTLASPSPLEGEGGVGGDTNSSVSARTTPHPTLPLKGGGLVSGLILVAPAVWGGESMPFIFRGSLWASAHIAPYWRLTGSDLKILATNNMELLRRMSADPLIIKATRIDAIYGLVGLMDHAYDAAPQITLPTLVLYGGNDQVIPRPPVEAALSLFAGPVLFADYPDAYHMLLRDLEGEVAMRDIESWILKPQAPLPSGYGKTLP